MAGYSELIKNFEKIRAITRDFFVYGFKGRGDYSGLSGRSYDNERRRIESYLSDLIIKNYDSRGKAISISSNTIAKTSNPLFKTWQTKSFTRNDCFLHFVILDIFSHQECLSVSQVAEIISMDYVSDVHPIEPIDTMTIRNKLNEYVRLGILCVKKSGKTLLYCFSQNPLQELSLETQESLSLALSFYKNVLPAGFIGHTLNHPTDGLFIYKQIYFSQTLDDDILLQLLKVIKDRRLVSLEMAANKGFQKRKGALLPVRILCNTKTGRRYLVIYSIKTRKFATVRIDYIKDLTPGDLFAGFDEVRSELDLRMAHSYSITPQHSDILNQVKVRLYIDEGQEQYVLDRIRREGRHGILTRIENNTFEYKVDVADTLEMVPWLRTFIGRIIDIEGTEDHVIRQFKRDILSMMNMYRDAGDL